MDNQEETKKRNIAQEKILVQKWLAGDQRARDEFVDLYNKLIYSFVGKTLRAYSYEHDKGLVDDLHHEVFAALLKDDSARLRKFEWKNNSSLATWIGVITGNLVVDHIRKMGKVQSKTISVNGTIDDEENIELIHAIGDEKSAPSNVLSNEEDLELFGKAIESLPEKDRQLVELLFYQEVSYEKVAIILEKSVGSLYMQKKRIVEKLQEIVEKIS